MDPETKKYLDSISNRLLNIEKMIKGEKEKSTFVTANQLKKVYGINNRQLFRLRTLGQIEYKKTGPRGIRYRLESLPRELIKQTA